MLRGDPSGLLWKGGRSDPGGKLRLGGENLLKSRAPHLDKGRCYQLEGGKPLWTGRKRLGTVGAGRRRRGKEPRKKQERDALQFKGAPPRYGGCERSVPVESEYASPRPTPGRLTGSGAPC